MGLDVIIKTRFGFSHFIPRRNLCKSVRSREFSKRLDQVSLIIIIIIQLRQILLTMLHQEILTLMDGFNLEQVVQLKVKVLYVLRV